MNKITKPLARLNKEKQKTQNTKMRNESEAYYQFYRK